MSLEPLKEFQRQLAAYLRWTKKSQGPAIEDRGRKMRFELYRQFRAIAKTASALRSELNAIGIAGLRRRKDPKTGKPVSFKQEISLRVRSIRFLSISFLFRSWRYSREGQDGQFKARNRRQKEVGSALVRTKEGNERPSVMISSFLTGVKVQNDRRRIADRALLSQARDMNVYIRRKHNDYLRGQFNRLFPVMKIGA